MKNGGKNKSVVFIILFNIITVLYKLTALVSINKYTICPTIYISKQYKYVL